MFKSRYHRIRLLMTGAFVVFFVKALMLLDSTHGLGEAMLALVRDQLRTPDMGALATMLNNHTEQTRWLGFVVTGMLVFLAAFLLIVLRADGLVRARLREALNARAAADSAWHRLDEAIESLSEGFVLFDENDRLVHANSKYREIYAGSAQWIVPGATFEQIIRQGALAGQYQAALADPEAWVRERLAFRQTVRNRGIVPIEQQLADGRWLMVSDRAMSNGATVGIRTDITELKQNMIALERAREDLRLESARAQALAEANRKAHKVLEDAIAALQEGFALWDAQDRLITCNARYIAVFPRAGAILKPGTLYADFIRAVLDSGQIRCEGTPEQTVEKRQKRRRKGSAEGYVEQLPDGRWVRVTNRPVEDGGIVTVFADITEHKLREIELMDARTNLEAQADNMRQLKEMAEAANAAKSGFLAMISHEIRTPMNAVLGLSGLLGETALDAEQRRFVEGIEESGAHLIGLINDLLDFTRLEAEKLSLDLAPVSLRELIGGAERMMRVLAHKKGLALNIEIAPDLPDTLEMDAARFSQVLINLIGNAIKFTERGYVTLRVCGKAEGEVMALHVSVSDTGMGIPPDMAARLFKPFERAQTHDQGQTCGTGLGLAITARLLGLMGGTISLREGGPGATFDVGLRVRILAGRAKGAVSAPLAPGRVASLNVLVAEDTPASQLVIRTLLEKRGHFVEVVSDGEQALLAAQRGGFDLVMLDLQMPRMSGLDVVRAIRALPGGLGLVPVVALSAQAFPADRVASLDAGFDEHLAKPLRASDIERLIVRVAKGEFHHDAPFEVVTDPPDENADSAAFIRRSIRELVSMTGAEAVVELIDLALANIEDERASLATAAEVEDLQHMRRAAHKLAGVLAQYGAQDAARLAVHFERASDGALRPLLDPLMREVDAARALLETERGRLSA